MRYEILDDAKASFAQIYSGGSGWGSGNYTTAVAVGPTSGARLDLYFGNQDTGTFASTNAEDPKPTWLNVDCCDSFEVPSNQTQMLVTVCCFSPGRFNRLFLRQPGMIDGAEINTYPAGNLRGFRPTDDVAMFGPTSAAVITTSGVFITTNINASPIVWTQLGAGTTPANARHVTPVGPDPRTIFYVQAPSGDLSSPDTLWRYSGTAPGAVWQQVQPPGGAGQFIHVCCRSPEPSTDHRLASPARWSASYDGHHGRRRDKLESSARARCPDELGWRIRYANPTRPVALYWVQRLSAAHTRRV